MNLANIKAGNFVKIVISNSRSVETYYIAKIHGFVLDMIIPGDTKLQMTCLYPRNQTFTNITLSYDTLKKLKIQDVNWSDPEKLMKLIYG